MDWDARLKIEGSNGEF